MYVYMGAWGYKIFEDDTTMDALGEIRNLWIHVLSLYFVLVNGG
jgi:hypothetical protein